MLMYASGTCDKCSATLMPLTIQEATVICKKCGKEFTMCIKCQLNGCLECGGKLESQMELAAKNNIMF